MSWLLIQKAGAHDGRDGWTPNDHMRECLSLQHALRGAGFRADVWGKGYPNFDAKPDMEDYDYVLCLENYDTSWVPRLDASKRPLKMQWIIDLHCGPADQYAAVTSQVDVVLHSTKSLMLRYAKLHPDKRHLWFPNAFDARLFGRTPSKRAVDVAFVGSVISDRRTWIDGLKRDVGLQYGFKTGSDMMETIRGAKVHWNKSIGPDVNYRCFETTALGTCLVTNRLRELEDLGFEDGKNCLMYDTYDECVEKISGALESGSWASLAAGGALLSRNHSYDRRVADLLPQIGATAPADPHKKVISFALWGSSPKYTEGMLRNAELAPFIYPGWEVRCYTGDDVPHEVVRKLRARSVNVVPSSADGEDDWAGLFWRFRAMCDPQVEFALSRDADSRLSERERAAVAEWEASGKAMHIMRDHPWHTTSILGGMWGLRRSAPGAERFGVMLAEHLGASGTRARYQDDQTFLRDAVYPSFARDSVVHDGAFLGAEKHAREFPTERQGAEFVGSVFEADESRNAKHDAMLSDMLANVAGRVQCRFRVVRE